MEIGLFGLVLHWTMFRPSMTVVGSLGIMVVLILPLVMSKVGYRRGSAICLHDFACRPTMCSVVNIEESLMKV